MTDSDLAERLIVRFAFFSPEEPSIGPEKTGEPVTMEDYDAVVTQAFPAALDLAQGPSVRSERLYWWGSAQCWAGYYSGFVFELPGRSEVIEVRKRLRLALAAIVAQMSPVPDLLVRVERVVSEDVFPPLGVLDRVAWETCL